MIVNAKRKAKLKLSPCLPGIVTEVAGFPRDAEVLTKKGWVRFDEYDGDELVQVDEHGIGTWVKPLALQKQYWEGRLIHLSVRGWSSTTTPYHKLISMNPRNLEWRKHPAKDAPMGSDTWIPRVIFLDEPGIALSDDQIRLSVAISADGTIDHRKNSGYNGIRPKENRYVRFGLKKERKIERLREILRKNNIEASDNTLNNGIQSICFSLPSWVPGRFFPFEWIAQASLTQRKLIIMELFHWDGNGVPNRIQAEYSSKLYHNAVFVQTLAHTAGFVSSIMRRQNPYGRWFKVSILYLKRCSNWTTVKKEEIPYAGHLYGVKVPLGAILVRHAEKISVSGD